MNIGGRIRTLRQTKHFTQGDIEERTGLMKCYISKVENGCVVPGFKTLKKFARALEAPLHQIVYDSEDVLERSVPEKAENVSFAISNLGTRTLEKLRFYIDDISERDRALLVGLARKMASSRECTRIRTAYSSSVDLSESPSGLKSSGEILP